MSKDETIMQECLRLAETSQANGDYPFGCVIIDAEEHVLSTGRNQEVTRNDVSWHAEMEALRTAQQKLQSTDLSDCTLYTNGEPCVMCAAVIRRTGIHRVVVGAPSASSPAIKPDPLTDPEFSDTAPPVLKRGVLLNACLHIQGRESEIE